MADNTDPSTRSRVMSRIRGKNTKAEVSIRKRLFAMGYRYRLHVRSLPGCPDIVLRKRNASIFINGCFWHRHTCHLFKMPATRKKWWETKLEGNRNRDLANIRSLRSQGWRVLVIWECAWRKADRNTRLDQIVELASKWIESNITFKEIKG